jgi:hypothetical protein
MTIALHLGAHKTATTYFQSRLLNSREPLLRHGVNYIPLDITRENITKKLGDCSEELNIASFLESQVGHKHLLVSDENLAGWIPPFRSTYDPYPFLRDRIQKLIYLLKDVTSKEVAIFFTLRNPIDYLISRYCEHIRHSKFIQFEKYVEIGRILEFTWMYTVDQLRSLEIPIFLSDFSDTLRRENEYLQGLTFSDSLGFASASESTSTRRSKLSLEAYELMKLASVSHPPQFCRKVLELLDKSKDIGSHQLTELIPVEIIKQSKAVYTKELSQLGIRKLFRRSLHVRL